MARKGKGEVDEVAIEKQLFEAADKLRSNMDAAEYKHVVLGLVFLKYISDAFEEAREQISKEEHADVEDRDEYRRLNVLWVPPDARWNELQNRAKDPEIGAIVDAAMDALERDNPVLKGVLPKDYGRVGLDKVRLGQLIDLFSNLGFRTDKAKEIDLLGRVYEYFLSQFASLEGKKGGQFYTPRHVVQVLVEMLEPFKGRVYDPCCGSGGMFVQSKEFVDHHANGNGNGGKAKGDISIYGRESNYTTWRLAKMNLAIRGIEGQIHHGDSFHNDKQPDLRADYVLANPPFNDSDWNRRILKEDKRWVYGVPPASNANFAWVQHFLYHLSQSGTAGFVLANGSMSSNSSGEGEIRKNIIEADLVDCMVALPGQLFYSTQIPVCLWFLTKGKSANRKGKTLFIDARNMGVLVTRKDRELTPEEIAKIADTYHAWKKGEGYEDVPGFCKSAELEEIRKHGHVLTPGRYVGLAATEEDDEPFEEKMSRLTAAWGELQTEARRLDELIEGNLKELGFRG